MVDRPRIETPAPPGAPSANGNVRDGQPGPAIAGSPPAAALERASRFPRGLLIAVVALVALIGGGLALYRWWDDSTRFVSTDNAQIAGRLVQVGSLTAGRVAAVRYDVGDRVGRDDVVATLHVGVPVGATSTGVPRVEFRPTSDTLVEVRAPVAGVVVARGASPNDTVPAGQTLLTLVDPEQLWINANVEETQIRRVHPGQRVIVRIDALNLDLEGQVVAVTPAAASTFSLLPAQNTSGNFTRVTQLVPVKIALLQPDPRLMIGTSASVKIAIADR